MRSLHSIFNVFSRREKVPENIQITISNTFRNRVLLLCRDSFDSTSDRAQFWKEIHHKFTYLHGTFLLSKSHKSLDNIDDIFNFLSECEAKYFLDFVEYIFQVQPFLHIREKIEFTKHINSFFEVDGLPYFLTEYVTVEEKSTFYGAPSTTIRVKFYPKVIMHENQLIHSEAIKPVLLLLTNPDYSSANKEFLDALQDYRNSDFGDCLTKCGSSFESVMKIICHKKKWPYKETDTASALLKTIILRSSLDSFFETPLILIAAIRNKLSKSHGAGVSTKFVSKHVASYAINVTAAAILLLVDECR